MPYRHQYDPNQPRVPAGHSDGGQWMGGSFGADPRIQRTLLARGPMPRTPSRAPASPPPFPRESSPSPAANPTAAPAQQTLLGAALALFTLLSRENNPDRQAIISFRAREFLFREGEPGEFLLEGVSVLNRNEVKSVCDKLETVQKATDDASRYVRGKEPNLEPAVHGTKVHTKLAENIRKIDDPDLKAEVSRLKGKHADVKYGTTGSVRVDVLENLGNGTFCAYDAKTGDRPLGARRMHELAKNIARAFKTAPIRIIVIEVRPTK